MTNGDITKLNQIASRPQPSQPAHRTPHYDFEELGTELVDSMVRVAESHLVTAQNLYEETKLLADKIHRQVQEHSDRLERVRLLGQDLLEANRRFNGDGS